MFRSLRFRLVIVALGILVLVLAPGAVLLRGAVRVEQEVFVEMRPADGASPSSANPVRLFGPEYSPEASALRRVELDRVISRYFWAIGVALVALMTPTLFRLLRPVRELTDAVQRFAAGDRAARVTVRGHDELATLGAAFNEMGDRIAREESLRNALVADVAHELRTPLTNLRGQLEAIQDGLASADAPTIASLRDETLLLARIVEDLQLLALADAGELSIVRAPVDVAALVTRTAAASRAQFDAKKIELALELEPDLPALHGDADRLGQVLRNLLSNAARHAPPSSRVTLAARRVGATLELSVSDRGPGIPPDLLPRLFHRFVRGDPSRTRATGGAGLGLSVVKTLVEAHGGSVHAESRPEGTGARFAVRLPVATESISG